jgi:hypothetical protein
MKHLYKGMVAAALLATTSFANAGTVSLPGGVTYSELPTTNADFGQGTFRSSFDFVQWWEHTDGTATSLTDMFIDINSGGAATDYSLNGYAELNVNSATGSFQCNGCEMTFAFSGLGLTLTPALIDNPAFEVARQTYMNDNQVFISPADFALLAGSPDQTIVSFTPGLDLANSAMSIYLDDTPDLDIGLDIGDNTNAVDGTEWLELSFAEVDFGVIVASADAAVAGLNRADSSFGLDVIGGIAADSFTNADDIRNLPILSQLVDMVGFGLSGDFSEVAGVYEIYSVGGTGTASGFAVTEPTTIAIFGLGLLGFAAASRRKQS